MKFYLKTDRCISLPFYGAFGWARMRWHNSVVLQDSVQWLRQSVRLATLWSLLLSQKRPWPLRTGMGSSLPVLTPVSPGLLSLLTLQCGLRMAGRKASVLILSRAGNVANKRVSLRFSFPTSGQVTPVFLFLGFRPLEGGIYSTPAASRGQEWMEQVQMGW